MLIATFDNGEEMVFHDLLLFLEEKRQIEVGDEFSIYTLKYGDFGINPKSRTVKRVGNKFDILRLLASHPKQVLYQKVGFLLKSQQKRIGLSNEFFQICKDRIGRSKRYLTKDYKEGNMMLYGGL